MNADAADKIAALVCRDKPQSVLEIGAGAGALTVRLLECVERLRAMEIDRRLAEILREDLGAGDNLEIETTDILKVDLGALLTPEEWQIVGNLPYYISGPIIGRLLEQKERFSRAVLMLQEEVADRLVAAPGNRTRGALSVKVQAFFEPHKEFRVKRSAFYPRPEVDSAVVSLARKEESGLSTAREEALFNRLVEAGFAHRRKKLENSLLEADFAADRTGLVGALDSLGIGGGRRAEELSVSEFVALAKYFVEEGNDASS